MFTKKILIDLDGVLNEYGKEKFNENHIPEIKVGAYEFLESLFQSLLEIILFIIYIYTHLTSVLKRVINVLHKALQGF